jgi:hypothetical protein
MICDIGDLLLGTPARISAANARAVHRRPTHLAGPCFLRYSLADGTRPWEHVGDDPSDVASTGESLVECRIATPGFKGALRAICRA